mmetsp:Transcript_9599/g.14745  ORF Transcript_9599/g.14745 Transcript_9599/m.14745 type:complete len:940 (-) Transcript_9599:1442-4261(-)
MATSLPKTPSGWSVSQGSSQPGANGASGLEAGIAGMNLMNPWPAENNRAPALSVTSLSDDASPSDRVQSFVGIGQPENVDGSTGGSRGSPPYPASPIQHELTRSAPTSVHFKPSGMGGTSTSLPSPIGKSQNNNHSTESTILSLTPPSSLDGNSDIFSKSSPFFEAPPPPNLEHTGDYSRNTLHRSGGNYQFPAQDNRRGSKNFDNSNDALTNNSLGGGIFSRGSFDSTGQNDGLRGLGALRERAQSSPGPLLGSSSAAPGSLSTSPHVPENSEYRQPPRHVRTNSGNRPPLSGAGFPSNLSASQDGAASISSNQERSFLNQSFQSQVSVQYRDSNPHGYGAGENHQSQGFSNIPRPDMRTSNSESFAEIATRGRTMSLGRDPKGTGRGGFNDSNYHPQQNMDQLHAHKFGSLQTLDSHLQQQRGQPQMQHSQMQQIHLQSQQQGAHMRSFSGNMQNSSFRGSNDDYTRYGQNQMQHSFDGNLDSNNSSSRVTYEGGLPDDLRFSSMAQNNQLSRSVSAGSNMTGSHIGGSGFLQQGNHHSQPSLAGGVEGHSFNGSSSFQGRQHQLRDDSGVPGIANSDELAFHGAHDGDRHGSGALRQDRVGTPSQSPLHMTVGGHIRQFSDGSVLSVGSTPRGPGSSHHSQNPNTSHHSSAGQQPQIQSFEDDLTHPLVGEHIDDPGDDSMSSNHGMIGKTSQPNSVQANAGHPVNHSSHSAVSLEQVSPATHYNAVENAHHRGASSASVSSGPRVVYNVKFKRTQRNFIPGPRVTRDLKIGCYVKVEADRGEDLGIIVGKVPAERYNVSGRSSFRSNEPAAGAIPPASSPSGASDLKRIIRNATHDEVSLLAVKREEEEELLKICRSKVRQRNLTMHVIDAEYQFDRHKLTFFFEAEGRIDFRELVRDLFSMYKTRIWMQQLDKNGTTPTGSVDGSNPSAEENNQ